MHYQAMHYQHVGILHYAICMYSGVLQRVQNLPASCPRCRSLRDWVRDHLTFDKAGTVSVFETTIRVLGGLLSAFELSRDQVKAPAADRVTVFPTNHPRPPMISYAFVMHTRWERFGITVYITLLTPCLVNVDTSCVFISHIHTQKLLLVPRMWA